MGSKLVDITEKIEEKNMEELLNEATLAETAEKNSGEDALLEPIEHPLAALEAILFSVGDSVAMDKLAAAIGRDREDTFALISEMKECLDADAQRGITIAFLEDRVQLCSKSEMFEHIIKVAKTPKNYTLTDVLLETLSIIAFKQPVTRLEIEKIRGVSCEHAVNRLIELDLVKELGRMDAPGRPILFGTTEQFLRSFHVESLDELPDISPERLEEFKAEAEKEINVELKV